MILNFNNAPKWQIALPVVGLIAGAGLAYYQKKDCIGCYLGYSLSGLILGSVPLLFSGHSSGKAIDEKVAVSSMQETTSNTQTSPDAAKASVSGTN